MRNWKAAVNVSWAVSYTHLDVYKRQVNVHGGGYTGQAGAIRHGIARALLQADADYRPVLKLSLIHI